MAEINSFRSGQISKLINRAEKSLSLINDGARDVTGRDSSLVSKYLSSDINDYVIIPPEKFREKNRLESVVNSVGSNNDDETRGAIKEELELIGGYVVSLDAKTANELRKKDFIVSSDKEEKVVPDDNFPISDYVDRSSVLYDNHDPGDGLYSKIADSALVRKAKDEIHNISRPLEQLKPGNTGSASERETEELTLDIRPEYSEPRYDSELTRKYTGKGVGLAIIDSGIHPHEDFTSPENRIVDFVDFLNGKTEPYDDRGHGSHVTGCAAGNGSNSNGLYKGTAPEANLIGLKVLDHYGYMKESNLIKAIQWCVKNKDKHNIRVINTSLGKKALEDYDNSPTNIAIRKAREAGILVVASAGNKGPKPNSITCPGDCWSTLSVGSMDDMNTRDRSDDIMSPNSSRGPTKGGLMKPDIVAPGEGIISILAPGTEIEEKAKKNTKIHEAMEKYFYLSDEEIINIPRKELESLKLKKDVINKWYESPASARLQAKEMFEKTQIRNVIGEDGDYTAQSGTSMASPTAAGIATTLFGVNSDLTPDEAMNIINKTAEKLPGDVPVNEQGNGAAEFDEAIKAALAMKE
jgi:subtilisin family serine protease